MYNALEKPSLAAIRTRFIQEGLRQHPPGNAVSVRIGVTGRTSSGKSTLGNRLVGSDHFLKSDGHINCTDQVSIIRFSSRLEYMDLPGVSSSDRLENYNRAALGMPQVADWPQTDTLTTVTYTGDSHSQEEHLPVKQLSQSQLQPDILLYLVAPHQNLGYSDAKYMLDLLQHYGSERVIFVLNLFTTQTNTHIAVSTPQNITDAKDFISKAFQAAGLDSAYCKLVEVNCWSGEGLLELVDSLHSTVDEQKGRVFAELIRYQQERTPMAYIDEIKRQLTRHLVVAAREKPEAVEVVEVIEETETNRAKNPLKRCAREQQRFLEDVLGHKLVLPKTVGHAINTLIEQITSTCTRQISEPIVGTLSRPIYEYVPVYENVKEQVPVYEKRQRYKTVKYYREPEDPFEFFEALGNKLDGGTYGIASWKEVPDGYEEVIVGYETKKHKEYKGTRQIISRYESYEQVIEQRVVTLYDPFGSKGAAFLAAHSHLLVVPLYSSKISKDVQHIYSNKLLSLSSFSNESWMKEMEVELDKHQAVLFDKEFTSELRQALHL